ncbi:hypothetical protein Tco_0362331, partial [Tanacetum coccineum]
MESIRCHFFNGVEHNGNKQIWVKWSRVLASKENGGLGVSSFYALNRALLFKRVWRFRTQQSSIWTKLSQRIHVVDHTFLELHYWTLTLEVSQTSILITGVSSLIPSSSRIPTILGHVVNLLAIPELYSTLPIVVT